MQHEPENLCTPLAEWLRLVGLKVEHVPYYHSEAEYVAATLFSEAGPRYHFEYTWGAASPAHGTCTLWRDSGHVTTRLLTAQPATSLDQVQQLLLVFDWFARAERLASIPLPY